MWFFEFNDIINQQLQQYYKGENHRINARTRSGVFTNHNELKFT